MGGLVQSPHYCHLVQQIRTRCRFTGREMRPSPGQMTQLPELSAFALAKVEPFERGVLNDGFIEAHRQYLSEANNSISLGRTIALSERSFALFTTFDGSIAALSFAEVIQSLFQSTTESPFTTRHSASL